MHWLAHRPLYHHRRCCHRSSGFVVAQDGDIPEKELGQETNGLRSGEARGGEVDKQYRHSDKASLDAKVETHLARGINTDTEICLNNVPSTSAGNLLSNKNSPIQIHHHEGPVSLGGSVCDHHISTR